MHRLLPTIGTPRLPPAITPAERAHFAAGIDELVELMTSILAFAIARTTGRVPAFRTATSDTTCAICADLTTSVELPEPLVFDDRFVRRMLTVWDAHADCAPEDASTYLRATRQEYVVGIAKRDLVIAIENGDDGAQSRALRVARRIIGVWHGVP